MSDMGIVRTAIAIAPLTDQDSWREIDGVMVDTGSEYNSGAVALESLNLRIDLAQRQLVHAGPVRAAAA